MKTFYVSLVFNYEDIEVEAESKDVAIQEAKDVVRRNWVTPSFIDATAEEQEKQ